MFSTLSHRQEGYLTKNVVYLANIFKRNWVLTNKLYFSQHNVEKYLLFHLYCGIICTIVKSMCEETEDFEVGVYRSCPLSPYLFFVVICSYKINTWCMMFADDRVLVGESRECIQINVRPPWQPPNILWLTMVVRSHLQRDLYRELYYHAYWAFLFYYTRHVGKYFF